MLPSFIIIGAMKGGTTSLYHYLATHPDVVPSRRKETDFFRSKKRFDCGVEWYEQLFSGPGRYAFEASPNYAKRHKFKGVPARMHSILPSVRLIYVLRDPIQRAISHYVHNRHQGRETQSFAQAIREPGNNYVQTSRYHYQMQAFLKYYAREQILLVESEKLHGRTNKTIATICDFLGLSPDYDQNILNTRFHKSSDKIEVTGAESSKRPGSSARSTPKPLLSDEDRAVLEEQLAPDVAKLRHYSGLPFSDWSL